MSVAVLIAESDIAFDCADGETILDAAERAGFAIPYSCRKGICSSCEGELVAGTVTVRGRGPVAAPDDAVLLCQARPQGDVTIAPKRIVKAEPVQRRTIIAKVHKLARPAADVAVVNLRFPAGQRAKFRPGQYLRILLPDGDSRNYSMANAPHESDGAELHIRHVPGGRFSEQVLAGLTRGDTLTVELPFGEFSLSTDVEGPAILLATGTGFAPIHSMVAAQIRAGGTRPLYIYWGARTEADLYSQAPVKWAAAQPWLHYVPVLSEPSETWAGRTGLVHRAVMEDHSDLSGVEVYACGNPLMIDASARDFMAAGLPEHAFFSDAFLPSGDIPAGSAAS